jgi:hypothetical protein
MFTTELSVLRSSEKYKKLTAQNQSEINIGLIQDLDEKQCIIKIYFSSILSGTYLMSVDIKV